MTNINGNKKEIRCQSIANSGSLYKNLLDNSDLLNKISQVSSLSDNSQGTNLPISGQSDINNSNSNFVSNAIGNTGTTKTEENNIRNFYEKLLDSIGVPMDQKYGYLNSNLKYSEDSDGKAKGSMLIPFGIVNRADATRKEITFDDVRSIKERLSSQFGFLTELKTDKGGYQIVFQTKPENKNTDKDLGYIQVGNSDNKHTKNASLNLLLENSLEKLRKNK